MAPQCIMLALMALNLGAELARDGRPMPQTEPGFYSLFRLLIGTAIEASILWWGGFWEPLRLF